jgi:GxxExxY protein
MTDPEEDDLLKRRTGPMWWCRSLIVELKSVEALTALHYAQLLTYMRVSGAQVGLPHQLQRSAPD